MEKSLRFSVDLSWNERNQSSSIKQHSIIHAQGERLADGMPGASIVLTSRPAVRGLALHSSTCFPRWCRVLPNRTQPKTSSLSSSSSLSSIPCLAPPQKKTIVSISGTTMDRPHPIQKIAAVGFPITNHCGSVPKRGPPSCCRSYLIFCSLASLPPSFRSL